MLYEYACMYRPPSPGAIPRDGLVEVNHNRQAVVRGRGIWGSATYDRELTAKETNDYELKLIWKGERREQ